MCNFNRKSVRLERGAVVLQKFVIAKPCTYALPPKKAHKLCAGVKLG